jgi:Ca-activated chloride channel family protein
MRKLIPLLLIGILLLCVSPALADGMILPEVLSPDYLAVRTHHVTVTIDDNHAVTRVEQEFYNPHDVPVTGRYLFPVPPDAILSRFEATVDGAAQAVARQDAAATNADLYASLAQRHDPSLLQYADWESLAFDLSLPAGGSRTMTLEYEEVLAPSGGLIRYRYVLSTERYSSLPLDEVSVTVDLSSSSGLASVYSPGYAVNVERLDAGRARVTWQAQHANPREDFELFFAPAESGFGGGLLTGERNGQDHFLFLFSPQADPGRTDALPKDIVFVIDRSGSMGGEKIEQARDALQFILGQLGAADRFSIISFNETLDRFSGTLQPVEGPSLKEARRFVERLSADGSTDLEAALQAGLEILDRSEKRGVPQMIVFLTDGLPTAGITDEARIAELVTAANRRLEARLHVFGVGYDVNTHLLDRLSADNGGTVTYVQPGENLELALTGFYAQIARPLLTDVGVEFEGIAVKDVYPEALPDLFEGSALLLAGRFQAGGDAVSVRVRGRAGDEWGEYGWREYVYHFDLAKTGGRDFVPRLWATRRVGALLDRVRVDGESDALVEEIRDLGLSYGIVTPYTTFVVAAQSDGAASAQNMDLYNNQAELNQAWGRVTIGARVQNQAYQEAGQANLAVGANVTNVGEQSLAQVGAQQVDLSLLRSDKPPAEPLGEEWVAQNVQVDRTIEFGSDEYFALAADPEARAFLQGGPNVLFSYQGHVVAVRDLDFKPVDEQTGAGAANVDSFVPAAGSQPSLVGEMLVLAARLLPVAAGAVVVSLAAVALIVYRCVRS